MEFDHLIIGNDKRLTDKIDCWSKLDDRMTRELASDKTLHTPVNFIVHTLQEVNDGLAHGRYFFMDVAGDGIALYEYDDKELHKPKPKTPEQALEMAQEYFDELFPLDMQRFGLSTMGREKGFLKPATVELDRTCSLLGKGGSVG